MKLSILTTITNPEVRQDKYIEALTCYCDLADEVVVVNGGAPISVGILFSHPKIKIIDMPWPDEWNWIELPRHLNAGKEACTGDWILKLDIDQLIHEKDFEMVRRKLAECPSECYSASFQKMSLTYGKKYYQKGGQTIGFRNLPELFIGKSTSRATDLCFAVVKTGSIKVDDYDLPVGYDPLVFKTGISYWNYDYFFKTKEFTKKEFYRFSRAYERYFHSWEFGTSEEDCLRVFLEMQKGRYDRAPYSYKLEDHPKYIRRDVGDLTKEQFGFNGWGLLKI